MSHTKVCDINWDELADDIRRRSLREIGARPIDVPRPAPSGLGAEWRTKCDVCGIDIHYATTGQDPDETVKVCEFCQK